MASSASTSTRGLARRDFLKLAGAAALAAAGAPLFHFRAAEAGLGTQAALGSWEDLYRSRWTWDRIAKGSHGWANCRSACAWDLYVKDGIVVREEQSATYEASEAGVPDFNPRGCQKGACYTELMYGPTRIASPLKRVGERGSGQWEPITWEQAIDEISHKMIDIAEEWGPDTIYQDLGPNFDQGATTVGRFKFQMKAGGVFADNWAEIGDLNIGGTLTLGFAHVGGSSDEWFLSDFPVVWMMNPSVTQMPDAHFLYEARYNGSTLTVIDPQYTPTVVHADNWLPLRTGTDAALGLAVARHIWDSGAIDLEYVREQTDLPLLVRLDNGRFLRGIDMGIAEKGERKEHVLYMWNPETGAPEEAPGSEGSDHGKITVEGFSPPIEGTFTVRLADGSDVSVTTVGSILREHLDPWTFERAAAVTDLAPELIETFADGFARAERPMILSSWGSNRFLHSDLMNRTKLLCLSLKGAIGKRGAGYQATGFVDISGFGTSLQLEQAGWLGKLRMMAGLASPREIMEIVIDVARKRKSGQDIAREMAEKGEREIVCATSVTAIDYRYQGIAPRLEKDLEGVYPRPLSAYMKESDDKGWNPTWPADGQPKIYISGGTNLLRRTNHTETMMREMWPKIDLAISIDQRMNFTAMHSDYVLPAAGWYEKSGIKYAMSYIPYLHYCDAAVQPVGDSKDEWEIFWLLSEKIQEIARDSGTLPMTTCGKREVDWKNLHDQYSCEGHYGAKDAEKVSQAILDDSPSCAGMTVEGLKKTGIEKYRSAGVNMAPTHIYNTDWEGEGVLTTLTHMTEHKWHWPTLSGRQQFYLDHPWFLEAGEQLPTHRESAKAGGDFPFQLVSCHSRWSIHSTWRETPLLMRLQRGEPLLYLNSTEAKRMAVADNGWAEIYNELGSVRMRVKHSTAVRPGVAYYYHAWEPHQFPDHKSYKWLIPGLINPLHVAGGEGHIRYGINHLQAGTAVQDTRIGVRPWKGDVGKISASESSMEERRG